MTIDFTQLLVFGILCATLHWFIARSQVMRWFWSRQRGRVDSLLRCPACSGWWLGLGLWCLGVHPLTGHWWAAVLTGALGMWLTPVVESVLLWSLAASAVEKEETDTDPDVT